MVTHAVATPSTDQGTRPERPVKVYGLTLKGASVGRRELPRTDTEPFFLVGVTWTGGARGLSGTAQVRTRSVATTDPTASSDPASASPTASTPETTASAPTGTATDTASPDTSPSPTAPASTVPRPPILSRADRGTDETISPEAPECNGDVKVTFAHHTAGTNDYTCDQAPVVIRSISTYDVQVLQDRRRGHRRPPHDHDGGPGPPRVARAPGSAGTFRGARRRPVPFEIGPALDQPTPPRSG
ncbi:hypothetical protein ACH4F6_24120 [Streptomyces sp. NPDC017936]|uniref:hypothetical protein n=1 Tax=Streptomyces sp. NPDC017936 TaxID=3365016 RepID=UPI0037B65DEA